MSHLESRPTSTMEGVVARGVSGGQLVCWHRIFTTSSGPKVCGGSLRNLHGIPLANSLNTKFTKLVSITYSWCELALGVQSRHLADMSPTFVDVSPAFSRQSWSFPRRWFTRKGSRVDMSSRCTVLVHVKRCSSGRDASLDWRDLLADPRRGRMC